MVFGFGSSGSARSFQPFALGSNLLAGWYIARASVAAAATAGAQLSGASSSTAKITKSDVPAPWDPGAKPSPSEDLKRQALASGTFLDTKDFEGYSDTKAPKDHKQLFALHQALKKLQAVAAEAAEKTTSDFRRSFLERRFGEGMSQISSYLSTASFTGVTVVAGKERTTADSTVGIPRGQDIFRTKVLHEGAFDAEVDAFQGDRAFTVTARKLGVDIVVDIDLDDMGATPRTLDNVASFINTKLADAGIVSRFKRVKIGVEDKNGIIPGQSFGFQITGSATEKLLFSAPASAEGALYLAGTSGKPGKDAAFAGQITKLGDLDAAAPATAASARFETVQSDAEAQGLKINAAQAGPDGSMFVLATSDLSPDGGPALRGEKDVVLAKYDSTGRRLWTRVLGASATAEGASLAVAADGSVTVAGSMKGAFGGTVDRGGADGFVTRYNAAGTELWTHRLGGFSDDAVDAVTVGDDGTIYVAGRTKGGLTGAHGGGSDAFVRAINANGGTLWTRQFGDGDEERATALAIADDGALLVASVEGGEGFLRKLNPADGVSPPVWEHSFGSLDEGSINAIHADATGIYVTGAGREGMTLSGSPVAHAGAGARDAFVVAFDDGATPTVRFETFLGSAAEDVARDIVVAGGSVYVAGYTDGALPGGGTLEGTRNAFAARLDATTGALDWSTQVTGRGGHSEAAGLVFDAAGSSDLDVFGLPVGELDYQDERAVSQRTAARAGDHFYVSVNGGGKRKIMIDADDTLRELTFKLNAVLVLDGEASVSRAANGDVLKIKPKPGDSVELIAGSAGADLLAAIGLEAGVVAAPAEKKEGERPAKTFGLGLSDDLKLGDRTLAEAALKTIDQAMTNVRAAYREITRDPALDALINKKPMGAAPAHMLAKISSYQEALARLGGGF